MTQTEFEKRVAEALNDTGFEVSRRDVQDIMDVIAKELELALNEEARASKRNGTTTAPAVVVRGLGRWRLADRKARMGRNPQTGEKIKIKASRKLAVRATAPMAEALKAKR
jgi:DNA-binding protein HU-beta